MDGELTQEGCYMMSERGDEDVTRERVVTRRDSKFELDCRDLLVRHRNGESNAFSEFVAIYRAPIYSYLVRCSVPPSTRDDLFQEVLIKIHNSATSYNQTQALNPWIFTIVANSVRSHFRHQRVREIVSQDEGKVERTQANDCVEKLAQARESAVWLEEEIEKLPMAQREVVLLVCIECLEQKEVAKALNIPLSTVKTHLRRARMTLTKALLRRKAQFQREVSV